MEQGESSKACRTDMKEPGSGCSSQLCSWLWVCHQEWLLHTAVMPRNVLATIYSNISCCCDTGYCDNKWYYSYWALILMWVVSCYHILFGAAWIHCASTLDTFPKWCPSEIKRLFHEDEFQDQTFLFFHIHNIYTRMCFSRFFLAW